MDGDEIKILCESMSATALPVIQLQRERIAELEAEVERLREALERVEWHRPPYPVICGAFCPWCGRDRAHGHRFDCMRQAALEKGSGE